MKPATKYIFMAIGVEIIVAMATFWILEGYESLLHLYKNISEYIITLILLLIISYIIGQRINYTYFAKSYRKLIGILLMFFFLYLYISISPFIFKFQYAISEPQRIFNDIITIIIYTTLFGGIQTLLIGIWLGYKLSRIKE